MDRRHAYDSTNVLEEATGRQLIRFSVLTFFKNRKKVNLILITHIIQLPASYQYLIENEICQSDFEELRKVGMKKTTIAVTMVEMKVVIYSW